MTDSGHRFESVVPDPAEIQAPHFKIGTLAARTGFTTHVLRAWENRYALLDPVRTDGGQRLCSDDDLAVLLRVKELTEEGQRIGEIVLLGRERLLAEGKSSIAQDPGEYSLPIPGEEALPADLAEAILEALPCGVVLTDPEGKTRWINRGFTELCGYTLAELYGRSPGELLQGPATDPGTIQRIRNTLGELKPCSERILNYHKDQHLYYASLNIAPLGVGEAHRGFVGLSQEIGPDPELSEGDLRTRGSKDTVQEAIRALAEIAGEGEGPSRLYMSLADLLASLHDMDEGTG